MFLSLLQFFATKFLFLALHLEAGSFPRPLSPQEEIRAFADLRAGDSSAREKLIRHNLRLVAHIAKKYYALPSEQDDLISIGTIGLMKAVDTFDSTRRARFSTYASRCIENAILSPAHFHLGSGRVSPFFTSKSIMCGMVFFLRSNEKARLQATICGSADGLSLWNHSVSVILIFALSYMISFFTNTRAFTFQKAFSAAPSGRFRYALSAKSGTVLGNSTDIYQGSYRYLFYQCLPQAASRKELVPYALSA